MNKWLIKSRTMCLSHYIFGSRPPNRPIATTQKQIHTLAQILRCSFVCEKYTQEPTNDVPINCTNGIILKRPRPRAHIPTLMLKYEYNIVCEMSSACVSHRLWFWKRAHIPHYELMQSPSICESWVAVCVCVCSLHDKPLCRSSRARPYQQSMQDSKKPDTPKAKLWRCRSEVRS